MNIQMDFLSVLLSREPNQMLDGEKIAKLITARGFPLAWALFMEHVA